MHSVVLKVIIFNTSINSIGHINGQLFDIQFDRGYFTRNMLPINSYRFPSPSDPETDRAAFAAEIAEMHLGAFDPSGP